MKFMQLNIYFNVVCQVHIVAKKDSSKRGHLIAQAHNTEVRWSVKSFIFSTTKSYQGIETEIGGLDNKKIKCA